MEPNVLFVCFNYFVNLDRSNAAIHIAPVKYSPITFRLAMEIRDQFGTGSDPDLAEVLHHQGQYAEDKGR